MTQPTLTKSVLKHDKIHAATEIHHGFWLFELRAGPKAKIGRWVVTNNLGEFCGEIKRPRYGTRSMEIYAGKHGWRWEFELKMQVPALAEQVLIDYAVEFVEKFGGA